MAKKPLGPEGARFKKADWNPQATGSKGTYISERDALEARVAELEKVNGITVETVSLTRGMIDGDGPFIVKFLEPDGAEFEYAALSGDPSATRAHFARVAKSQIADKESDTSLITPPLGEMADATVASWLKNPGDYVVEGELIAVIETDKATIELEAEISGQMGPHLVQAGDNFKAGDSIGSIVPSQANADAQWPYASALPPVAVIKSPSGERFISMPIAGTLKHLQADLAKVQIGDDLFSVAISPPYFIRWKQGRELYEATLLKEARAIRTASQYTPERINALITGGDAVMKERDRLRDQIAKDKNRVANATVVESKLGGFTIAAAIGWIAAIGLYIYSDLPIPFVGGSNAERSVLSEAQIACVKRAVETDYGEPYRLLPSSSYLDDADGDFLNFVPVNNYQDSIMGIRVQNIEISRGSGDWYTVELNVLNPIENNNGPLRYMGIDLRAFTFNDGGCTQIMKQNRTVSLVERSILEQSRRTRSGYDGVLLQPGEQRRFSYSFHFNEGQSGTPVVTGLTFLASQNP